MANIPPALSDDPRWGLLGTAQIAPAFIEGLRRGHGGQLAAVASRSPVRAAEFAATHNIPQALPSYEALLAADDIELLYIPLPNSLHSEWTVRALQAGKHVLCEKPLTTTYGQAQQVAKAAVQSGGYVAEGFMHRHHPQWETVRGLLERGAIGELVSMHSAFTFPLDPEETTPSDPKLGGGALLDVGCYCVHLARTLCQSEPVRVSAIQRGEQLDTSMMGWMQMANRVMASFECSLEQDERQTARLSGTEGTIIIEQPWLPGDLPAVVRVEKDGEVQERILTEAAHCHQLQIEAFVRAVRDPEGFAWPFEDSLNNARVIEALFAAARTGQTVELPQ